MSTATKPAPNVTPFLLARDAYIRWCKQRDACLGMIEQRLPRRSRLRTALMRVLTPQVLSAFRVEADGAACSFADYHGDSVFSSMGINAATSVFFGPRVRSSDLGTQAQSPGCALGLPEILMILDADSCARGFMNSVRELPAVLNAGGRLDACARRYEVDYERAISCLKEQRLDGEASHACSVYFRKALPADVGSRIIELAY